MAPLDEVALTFEPDGSILLHEVAIASGQGHETVLPEIVGRALEIDPLRITLLRRPPGWPGAKRGRRIRVAQHDEPGRR